MIFKIIINSLVFFSFHSIAGDMVGNDLITYFSSTCKAQGEYTRQALSDSQSLIQILENIKNDQDCTTISGGISQLTNLESKLLQLESQNKLNIEIEKLTAQENELMLQMSQTNDPLTREEINSTIRQIQINKASYVSEMSARSSYQGENVKDLYAKIVTSTNSLFNSISSNHRCLNKNPNLLPAITSLAGAIGSAAMSVNPALGLGIAAATDLIGHTVEAFRKNKYNRMIRKISDSSIALEGYKCVLESLSERWCSIQDAEEFLQLKSSIRRQSNPESGFKSAIRLHDRDIPILLDWLNKVRTGVPAATTADAQRQEEIFNREARVRSAYSLGNGVISQYKPLYEIPNQTPQDKYLVVKTIIGLLTNNNCSGGGGRFSSQGGGSPLDDIYNSDFAPFYLLGLDQIPREDGTIISFCQFDPLSQWPSGSYSPDLNFVKNRYEEWVKKAQNRVNQELTLVLQPDALQVLTTAYESTNNKWKYSTLNSLTNLIDFLNNFQPKRYESTSFKKIYEDTVDRLEDLKSIIDSGVIGDKYSDPKTALEDIFRVAQLQHGLIVFQSRLEMIVRVSVKEYLDTLNTNDSNVVAQLLAAESFLDVLAKVNGTDNFAIISADIKRAKPIAVGNMNSFMDVFGNNINRILKKNHKRILKTQDPKLKQIYTRNSAEMCLLISSMPTWPKKVRKKYCLDSHLESVIPNGPQSETLTSDYLAKNFEDRNCGYRNYLRKSKIFQEWGIKL
jgi:hypothetical protein